MNEDRKDLNRIFRLEFRRAQRLAGWSFVGILMPIIGIILGALSRSIIKSLSESNSHKLSERFRNTKDLALGGIVVSIIFLFVWWGVGIWAGKALDRNFSTREESAYSRGFSAGKKQVEESNAKIQQNNLELCLNAAQDSYESQWAETVRINGYSNNRLPADLADQLNSYLQQAKDECYRRADYGLPNWGNF